MQAPYRQFTAMLRLIAALNGVAALLLTAFSLGAIGGDPIAVTCRTLGELGQCGASNLCKTRSEASCKAKPAVAASEPTRSRRCRTAWRMTIAWRGAFDRS